LFIPFFIFDSYRWSILCYHRCSWHGLTTPPFSNFLFTNLFSIKFRYFFIISSLFPYFNLFVSIFIQSYANIKFTPYNRLSGQQMISGTQIISTHTEWQVGISLTFFFHFIYFLDFKFMSDLLHYKWEICIPNMTV
jgi:hypothetical protein